MANLRLQLASQYFGEIPPEFINYDFLGLHKVKQYHAHGYISKVSYYLWNEDGTPDLLTGLVVEDEYQYFIDPNMQVVVAIRSTQKWYDFDGNIGHQRTIPQNGYKPLIANEIIAFDNNRRKFLIEKGQMFAMQYLFDAALPVPLSNAFDLLNSVKVEIDLFIGGQPKPLVDALKVIVKPYLDIDLTLGGVTKTKRDWMVFILDQRLVPPPA